MYSLGTLTSPQHLPSPPGAPPTPTGFFSSARSSSPSSSTIQDISLDSTGSVQFPPGSHSPTKFSPLRGCNTKEYETQLKQLKNDNFTLKLRVYFLEERLSTKEINDEKEDLITANMELKVETEALKEELYDKQQLVRQASTLLAHLEAQYKEQVVEIRNEAQQTQQDLKDKIKILEAELADHYDNCRTISGDLNQLCGLAFDSPLDDEESHTLDPLSSINGFPSSPMKGIFSINESTTDPALSGNYETANSATDRIKHLEATVEALEDKVTSLQGQLEEKRLLSEALEQDVSNLKKEMEEQEEKMLDLESEVNEKDEKVDQLMQDLETRHLEIKAKDSTIQDLHDDLIKVEPEIEIKMQEIVERDRIIEEKLEQLEQQNKILVEIQITLDEKQKLIGELEENLRQAKTELEHKSKDLLISKENLKLLNEKIATMEIESQNFKKELLRKEKKIKDLTAQLKESLDMLHKASWEAETSGRGDDVREMADDEHDGLWAELEQKKSELQSLHKEKEEKENALLKAQQQIEELKQRANKAELLVAELKIQGSIIKTTDADRDKDSLCELSHLRDQAKAREKMLYEQKSLIATLQKDLDRTQTDLQQKRDDLKEMKDALNKKSNAVHDFITSELLGRREEVKNLQGKLLSRSENIDHIDALRRILQASSPSSKKKASRKPPAIAQLRSTSLSEIEDPPTSHRRNDKNKSQSPRPGRSSSFSSLENALFAHMGQKVYNTNQTFNTYVMPGVNDDDKSQCDNEARADVPDELSPPMPAVPSLGDTTAQHSLPYQGANEAIKSLFDEMLKIRLDAKALRQERKVLGEKLDDLQTLSRTSSRHGSCEKGETNDSASCIQSLKHQLDENEKQNHLKDKQHDLQVNDFQAQIQNLKGELKNEKKRITLQLLSLTSQKHKEVLEAYKEEIASLRKRLADSHNACDLMRTKLEELMEFLEEVLRLDRLGKISIQNCKLSRNAIINALTNSRELSHSLSQSLMIGTETSEPLDKRSSKFCLSMQDIQQADLMIPLTQNSRQIFSETEEQQSDKETSVVEALTFDDISSALDSSSFFNCPDNLDVVQKLNVMSEIIEKKDSQIQMKSDAIAKLTDQLQTLQLPKKNILKSEALGQVPQKLEPFCTSVPDMSQIDSRLYEKGVLICPEDTQSSPTSGPLLQYVSVATKLSKNEYPLEENSQAEAGDKASGLVLASPSESEAWSEPDRNVSLARIGLENFQSVVGSTERPISRCRIGRCTPLSSESDVDANVEDCIVQAGSKYKRRSDATEVKRLTSKLRGVEQINETLKAELHIYETLTQHFNSLSSNKSATSKKPDVSDKGVDTSTDPTFTSNSNQLSLSTPLLEEIQSLRTKLEEAIANNDLLRDHLEAALAGYLSEETKNMTISLANTQNELRTAKEKLCAVVQNESFYRKEIEARNKRISEIEKAASLCHASNQDLTKKVSLLRQEVKMLTTSLTVREDELCSLRSIQTLEEENLNMKNIKIQEKETEMKSLKLDLDLVKSQNIQKQQQIDELTGQITSLSQSKSRLESRIADQNDHIEDLSKTISKYEQDNSGVSEETLKNLQEALLKSETRLIEMTKEQFVMAGDRSRLQAQLASANTKANLLQKEIDEGHGSEDSCFSESGPDDRLRKLKIDNNENRLLKSENASLKKDFQQPKIKFSFSTNPFGDPKCISKDSDAIGSQLNDSRGSKGSLNLEEKSLVRQINSLTNQLHTTERNKQELQKELEAEISLNRSLRSELDVIKATRKESSDLSSCFNSPISCTSSLEFFHSSGKLFQNGNNTLSADHADHIDIQKQASGTFPNHSKSLGVSSCRSPDLGISSDGNFSSLERRGPPKILTEVYRPGTNRLDGHRWLCSDPSHIALVQEKRTLVREKETLGERLSSTKETLQQALEELLKANLRKSSIERIIDHQLVKTEDILRKSRSARDSVRSNYSTNYS